MCLCSINKRSFETFMCLELKPISFTHLRSKQHKVCSNSRFELRVLKSKYEFRSVCIKFELHRPKYLGHCFRKQHGYVLCFHDNGTWTSPWVCLRSRVYAPVLIDWLKLVCQSKDGERSVVASEPVWPSGKAFGW